MSHECDGRRDGWTNIIVANAALKVLYVARSNRRHRIIHARHNKVTCLSRINQADISHTLSRYGMADTMTRSTASKHYLRSSLLILSISGILSRVKI